MNCPFIILDFFFIYDNQGFFDNTSHSLNLANSILYPPSLNLFSIFWTNSRLFPRLAPDFSMRMIVSVIYLKFDRIIKSSISI